MYLRRTQKSRKRKKHGLGNNIFIHHGRIIELCESWHHVRQSYKWKNIRFKKLRIPI